MADYRQIHTSIWKDQWFMDLDPSEKLLFIYLFSNEQASMSGLYKVPPKVIAFETGLDMQQVRDAMAKFDRDGKVHYDWSTGTVWVCNMPKYHEARSATQQTRIAKDVALIPDGPIKQAYLQSLGADSMLARYPMATTMGEIAEGMAEEGDDDAIIHIAQRLTGLLVTPSDIPTITAWEREGVTEADIRDAMQWRVENNHPPVKSISQLAGGVKTARLRRTQSSNGRKAEAIAIDPRTQAAKVYR